MLTGPDGGSNLDPVLRRLEEVSWDFDGARSRSPLSAAHFHPARLISQIPAVLISRLSRPGDLVLDPFCGSGTTLTEAQRLGRRAVGFDINPISVLMSRVKTSDLSIADVVRSLGALRLAAANPSPHHRAPPDVQVAKWYEPRVAAGLASMHADIANTTVDQERDLKRFVFSSILIKVCRETRHWGYVCDNTQPLDNPGRDLAAILDQAIVDVVAAFKERGPIDVAATVHEASSMTVADHLQPASVELVVTSPPYEGVVDYVKAQRLSLEWLGCNIERTRLLEIGARSKRRRLRAAEEFRSDLLTTFTAVHKVLRPGGTCATVFGVSPSRAFTFEDFAKVMNEAGFELRTEHERQVALRRRMMPSILTEKLFLFWKPATDK